MKTNRRDFVKYSLGGISASVLSSPLAGCAAVASSSNKAKKNVLFIIVEDLKNIMGCYGNPLVQTPNLDRLGKKGVIFDRAYCQYPVCNPSRTSFLTGLRPDTTQILDNKVPWRQNVKNHTTLPKLFRDNGYHTIGMGKIFHGSKGHDDQLAWDERLNFSHTKIGKQGESRNMTGGKIKWCRWLAAEGTDDDQPDGQMAAKAVQMLKQRRDKPFFMALGFHKPHDPFEAPKKYFDMYPLDKLMPPVLPHDRSPEKEYIIGTDWARIMREEFTLQDRREFLRSYYACTSFADAQIGRVLDEMDRQNLWKDTAVLFVGDHGYNLGEYDWWNKAVLFEDSARVPMIAVVDGQARANTRCDQFVELVDLYPTFADLCGLKAPSNLEGLSFLPLLSQPGKPWKTTAYTQVQRGDIAGKSVRTKRWRYNEWTQDGQVLYIELFDHASDPQEYRNLAEMEDFKDTCQELGKLLKTGQNRF